MFPCPYVIVKVEKHNKQQTCRNTYPVTSPLSNDTEMPILNLERNLKCSNTNCTEHSFS